MRPVLLGLLYSALFMIGLAAAYSFVFVHLVPFAPFLTETWFIAIEALILPAYLYFIERKAISFGALLGIAVIIGALSWSEPLWVEREDVKVTRQDPMACAIEAATRIRGVSLAHKGPTISDLNTLLKSEFKNSEFEIQYYENEPEKIEIIFYDKAVIKTQERHEFVIHFISEIATSIRKVCGEG